MRLTVTLALLFLACACALPAKKKVTLVKDTNVGNAFAIAGGMSSGVMENNRGGVKQGGATTTSKPAPENEKAEEVTEVALVNKINTGSSVAMFDSVSLSVLRNSTFAGRIPFGY